MFLKSAHEHLLHLFEVFLLLFACLFPLQLHHLLQINVLFMLTVDARMRLRETLQAHHFNLLLMLAFKLLYLVFMIQFQLLQPLSELSFFLSKSFFVNFACLLLY
jgi:hypothetical protein